MQVLPKSALNFIPQKIKRIDSGALRFQMKNQAKMKTIIFLAMIFVPMLLFHVAFAVPMGSLVVTVKPEKNTLETGEIPVVLGTVTDQASKPIANAIVNISTSHGTETVVTDSDGKFRYQYTDSVLPNQYIVNVKAKKDGYGVGIAKTTFFVKGVPATSQQLDLKTIPGDKIKQDPTAFKILKHIEITKKKQLEHERKLKEIEDKKKFLEGQRILANQELQNDLQGWLVQFDPFTPRNAYALFVNQMNATFQNIFWGQFNFTEQKTNDGLAAKYQVLQNGGSSYEARKAFIQKATSPRDEIIKVNNDLNVKYGNASKQIQYKFDSYGKLPRNHK
ncbi:MAG TPA: carboxypeptidase-like regulatory domain-containing protein [Nitrosopumilaceae archaeon]|nr:carboxypeptidase-like regulatory domain-containing protein [Nitrosopumilaceae archaeon]